MSRSLDAHVPILRGRAFYAGLLCFFYHFARRGRWVRFLRLRLLLRAHIFYTPEGDLQFQTVETSISPGHRIGRFELTNLLSAGGLASVWEAFDVHDRAHYVLKLYPHLGFTDVAEQYVRHVQKLSVLLRSANQDNEGIVCSEALDSTESHVYQAFRFVDNTVLFSDVIKVSAPVHPSIALTYLISICRPLMILHQNESVHADLKPSNILISNEDIRQAFLIDFGMAQLVNSGSDLMLVGTPKYLAPDIMSSADRGTLSKATSSVSRAEGRKVGPYIDVYSLAIIMLELVLAVDTPPTFVTTPAVLSRLMQANPEVTKLDKELVSEFAELMTSMLLVEPTTNWEAISIVASRGMRLLNAFGKPALMRPQIPQRVPGTKTKGTETRILSMPSGERTKAILTLQAVSKKLLNRSAAFVQEGSALKAVSFEHDQMLAKINLVFANALARSQSTWRIGMTLTIVSFTVISAMLVAAVILTIVTGKASWALMFGGTSVPLIIGTLLWKPYDMAFNATIRSQQIELIHVQVVTVFKATAIVDERVKMCDQAVASLQSLYVRDASRVGSRTGAKKQRRD